MDLRTDQHTRYTRAPAKLNLYLEILGRRADGFHELETLMVPINLFDSLSFVATSPPNDGTLGAIELEVRTLYPQPRQTLSVESQVPTGKENIVVRALELLRDRTGVQQGARVGLIKRIPHAAGLGGASSDAAAVLRLANRAWQIGWPLARLAELAGEIGSDVPFFLSDGAAVCRGRGEQVLPLHTPRPMHFVVVKPDAGLSTAAVYAAHAASAVQKNDNISTRVERIVERYSSAGRNFPLDWMKNRLQDAAATVSPWTDRLKSAFDRLDFVGHQLSGSGSAYFGVCRHAQHARRLANVLRSQQLGLVYATRSCA